MKVCLWTFEGINDNKVQVWKGSCEAFMIQHPKQWHYSYCPYCGGKLEVESLVNYEKEIIKQAKIQELQRLLTWIESMQPKNKDSNSYADLIEGIVLRLNQLKELHD